MSDEVSSCPKCGKEISAEIKTEEKKEVPSAQRQELSSIPELLKKSWLLYRKKFVSFLLIIIIFTVPMALITSAGIGFYSELSGATPLGAGAAITFFLIAFFVSALGQIAFIYAISGEGLPLAEIFRKSAQRFIAFFWVYFLFACIIMAGLVMFIVPGLIFLVWFGLALFVLVKEDVRGINALLKSKAYVQGKWLQVFTLMLVVWILSFGLSLIPVLGPALSVLFMPFILVYEYLLYTELTEIKRGMEFKSKTEDRASWLVIALLGFLISIALVFYMDRYYPEYKDFFITPVQKISV